MCNKSICYSCGAVVTNERRRLLPVLCVDILNARGEGNFKGDVLLPLGFSFGDRLKMRCVRDITSLRWKYTFSVDITHVKGFTDGIYFTSNRLR